MQVFKLLVGIVLVFFTVMFMRCEKVTEISELIKNTQKIQVVFYNDTLPDTFVDITDKKDFRRQILSISQNLAIILAKMIHRFINVVMMVS